MIEIEQRSLRALEQDAVAVPEGAVDEQRGVGDIRPQALREALVGMRDLLERRTARSRRRARARRSSRRWRARSSGAGSSGRAGPGRGCRCGSPCRRRQARSHAAWCRSAGCRACARGTVQRDVPRHDQMGVPREEELPVGDVTAGLEVVELLDERGAGRSRSPHRSRGAPRCGGCRTGWTERSGNFSLPTTTECGPRCCRPGSGRRLPRAGPARPRSCPCPRHPTARPPPRSQAHGPFLHAAGDGEPTPNS